jgi:hypothetical protein
VLVEVLVGDGELLGVIVELLVGDGEPLDVIVELLVGDGELVTCLKSPPPHAPHKTTISTMKEAKGTRRSTPAKAVRNSEPTPFLVTRFSSPHVKHRLYRPYSRHYLAQGSGIPGVASSSIRRKFSALSSLFDYLCEHNAAAGNPVDGRDAPIGSRQ